MNRDFAETSCELSEAGAEPFDARLEEIEGQRDSAQ